MSGEVALVNEQGQDIAILAVKNHVVSNRRQREEMVAFGEREFGVRTALMAENGRTWGPRDIVNWLRGVSPGQLPWRKFTIG
jgi:hypothetical protein